MREHIENCVYHIEVLPPKQDSDKLDADLQVFAERFNCVMDSGYSACITDNAMGLLAFQGHELIDHLELRVLSEQVMLHLNTFHSKRDLDALLTQCAAMGIKYLQICVQLIGILLWRQDFNMINTVFYMFPHTFTTFG